MPQKNVSQKTFFFFMMLSLLVVSACNPQQHAVLRVGTNQWPGYETLYLARALGFIDSNGIRLKELTSSTETLRAFKQNQIDVAAVTLDEALLLAQTEPDLRIFLVMNISNGADKLIVKNDIQQLADLKGKTISVESTALGAYMMHNLLEAAQLTLNDVIIDSATVDQHFDRMTRGISDAVITFDPVASSLLDLGYSTLFDSSQIPNKIVDVLVTKQSVIEQQPHNISALVSAQWQSLAYMQANPDSAYQKIVPRLNMTTDQLAKSYTMLTLPDKTQNQQLLSQDNTSSLTPTLNELSRVLFEVKLIPAKPLINHLLTDEFVR
ncbi:MAG: ABC transporter substrate-binding protein [Gammaproteobacteria bacterium]|nr:ABC transporter substrate-binding protein [Gammaproteobacteria bacterium]